MYDPLTRHPSAMPPAMRDYVLLYINGARHEIRGDQARLTLSDYLRRVLGHVGTKIVCSEGDCGACTVVVGRVTAAGLDYQAVDSCILFLFQLDRTHVVTVEGLAPRGTVNRLQRSLVDCHGSQCGFCTPGFVMAMTALREQGCGEDLAAWQTGLTGNLCRCTGYVQILEAGLTTEPCAAEQINTLYPPAEMLGDFAAHALDDVELATAAGAERTCCPTSLTSALAMRATWPEALVVAGATDIGVRVNKGKALPATILDLNQVDELAVATCDGQELLLGARATWGAVELLCREPVPEFSRVLQVFGAPQIRNIGTVGGNLINASPIADSLPFFYVMDAELEVRSASATRTVPIQEFYQGYKQFDLRPGELLTRVRVPLPAEGELLRLIKVSRRRDLDISSFTAAIRLRLEGETIAAAALAWGGVGPTVLRSPETEAFLVGQEWSEATLRAAGDLAVAEVSPISDVRGSADYRRQLTRNVLVKFFLEQQPDAALV